MQLDELIAKTKNSLEARKVYAAPYEKDGVTVIAAAAVAGGGGAGTGTDDKGRPNEGGGFGLRAKPSGAYVIKDGTVRWEPAVDVNRLAAVIGAVVIAALLVGARIAGLRTRASRR